MARYSVRLVMEWVLGPANSSKPATGPWTSKTTCMPATRALAASQRWLRPRSDEERAVAEPTEDFAVMFEASLQAKRVEKGQTLEGTIVAIGAEVAFVDVGGKGEATIDMDELKDADGHLEVAVGDRIQALVTS